MCGCTVEDSLQNWPITGCILTERYNNAIYRYILLHKPTEWTEELRAKFIKFLDKFFYLLKCMQASSVSQMFQSSFKLVRCTSVVNEPLKGAMCMLWGFVLYILGSSYSQVPSSLFLPKCTKQEIPVVIKQISTGSSKPKSVFSYFSTSEKTNLKKAHVFQVSFHFSSCQPWWKGLCKALVNWISIFKAKLSHYYCLILQNVFHFSKVVLNVMT